MPSSAPAGTYVPNPYVIGQFVRDPAAFFGREDLFDFIRDELHQHTQVILLSGQRRIGKSSLLAHIARRAAIPGEDYVFVQYDLQNKARWPLGQILKDLAQVILRQFGLASPSWDVAPIQANPEAYRDEIRLLLRNHRPSLRLVLLLDEFDVLHESADKDSTEGFFQFLQVLVERDERLHIIAVIGRRLEDLPRLLGIFHRAAQREIGLLDEDSARRLIETPARGVLEYSQEALSAILDLTAGHPYFTQLLCHVIFSRMRDQGRLHVSAPNVEAAVPRAMETGEAGLMWFRDGMPLLERVVFTAAAHAQEHRRAVRYGEALKLLREHGVEMDRAFREAEQRLVRWGFLSDAGGASGPHHRVTIELVRRWLVRRFPLRGEIWDLQHLSPSAERRYGLAVELREKGNLVGAMENYHAALRDNPNHMEALCDLAEVTLEHGDAIGAVPLYKRAYAADPGRNHDGYVEALVRAGREWLRRNLFDPALLHFSDALAISPGDPEAISGHQEAVAGQRRALASRNPFLVGPLPPEDLVGREKEVGLLLNTIRKGGSALLHGLHGSGKTTLLHYVSSPDVWRRYDLDPKQAFVVYIDCRRIVPFSRSAFWSEVLSELHDQLEERDKSMADAMAKRFVPGEFSGSERELRSLIRLLGGRQLVLLIDEFDTAWRPGPSYSKTEMSAFLASLRYLRQRGERRVPLSILFASTTEPAEAAPGSPFGSPWYNDLLVVPLMPFSREEVEELMARMPQAFPLSDAERKWVHELPGGQPYLLHAALHVLFSRHAEDREFDAAEAQRELNALLGPHASLG